MTDRATIDRALATYREAAKTQRINAGYAGEWGDRGAGVMEQVADAYEAGLNGIIPAFLTGYVAEVERQKDPEYAEFLRLQSKFGKEGE